MEFTLSAYSLTLLIFSVLTLFLSVVVFIGLNKNVRWFGAMMVAVSIWAASDGVMVVVDDLGLMLSIVNAEYVGIALVPVFWLLFVFRFVGKEQWLKPRMVAAQFIFPILTLLMVWTNDYHHLHYQSAAIKEVNGLYGLVTAKGPWYIIHTTYFYCWMIFGMFLLLYQYKKSEGIYRKQTVIIILGSLVPWVANILVVFQVGPFNGFDPTPYGFVVTSFIVVFGFWELSLFDLRPIARNKVVDSMREGMVVLDVEDRIVDFNDQMLRIIGRGKGEVTGLGFGKLGFKDERWKELLEQDTEQVVYLDLLFEGEKRYYEINCKIISGGKRDFRGRLLMFRDITQFRLDQRRLEEQARELSELNMTKDRLLSIISHDMRGPLNSLTQFLEMSESGFISDQEFKAMLPKISENLRQVSGFMENLLVWAMSQLMGENIEKEVFDIDKELSSVVNLFKASIENKGIQVDHLSKGEALVFADPNMTRLVLRNLLSNALKFSDKGDKISIYLEFVGNQTKVLVEDTGVGIPEKNLDRIFSAEAFTTFGTQKEQGTGLGLMLSKDFVEKNGGEIGVESELGKGTKFFFTLPRKAKIKKEKGLLK
ncbi:PAS domain S-box protein [Echinicola marina]|uniref:sensor histidine kinase n=1 Tax=Echinicola marina TaxID=2859768 RepID=UPI001CF6D217|nr:histidine kinase N-terminal 7TM domain-containing protein [Echinicola marina]UCS91905.1 PAS domain S-box protein [Echinicola marina]